MHSIYLLHFSSRMARRQHDLGLQLQGLGLPLRLAELLGQGQALRQQRLGILVLPVVHMGPGQINQDVHPEALPKSRSPIVIVK